MSQVLALLPLIAQLLSGAPALIAEIEALISAVKGAGAQVPATPHLDAVQALMKVPGAQ